MMSERSDAIDRLHSYDKHYVIYSDKLSSACRQLAFAEGAVFWAFKEQNSLSGWIAIGFFLLVCYFVADSFRYYFGMSDYERLAAKARATLLQNENNYEDVNNINVNKRLERCLKWKVRFIFIASLWLIIVFVKTFLICN